MDKKLYLDDYPNHLRNKILGPLSNLQGSLISDMFSSLSTESMFDIVPFLTWITKGKVGIEKMDSLLSYSAPIDFIQLTARFCLCDLTGVSHNYNKPTIIYTRMNEGGMTNLKAHYADLVQPSNQEIFNELMKEAFKSIDTRRVNRFLTDDATDQIRSAMNEILDITEACNFPNTNAIFWNRLNNNVLIFDVQKGVYGYPRNALEILTKFQPIALGLEIVKDIPTNEKDALADFFNNKIDSRQLTEVFMDDKIKQESFQTYLETTKEEVRKVSETQLTKLRNKLDDLNNEYEQLLMHLKTEEKVYQNSFNALNMDLDELFKSVDTVQDLKYIKMLTKSNNGISIYGLGFGFVTTFKVEYDLIKKEYLNNMMGSKGAFRFFQLIHSGEIELFISGQINVFKTRLNNQIDLSIAPYQYPKSLASNTTENPHLSSGFSCFGTNKVEIMRAFTSNNYISLIYQLKNTIEYLNLGDSPVVSSFKRTIDRREVTVRYNGQFWDAYDLLKYFAQAEESPTPPVPVQQEPFEELEEDPIFAEIDDDDDDLMGPTPEDIRAAAIVMQQRIERTRQQGVQQHAETNNLEF